MRLGFIGTGTITAAMVRGLSKSSLRDWPVVLSPRNPDIAQALAHTVPTATVAKSNQAVIDSADVVVLAVRPQVAEEVLRDLRMRSDQQVISLVAGIATERIFEWTRAPQICRAIPLPFVEQQCDMVPVYPPQQTAMEIFGALGTALKVHDQRDFDVYASLSALMGTYFGLLEAAAAWAEDQGLNANDARSYLAGLFRNLGNTAYGSTRSFGELRTEHSTDGGLNEQVYAHLADAGGVAALTAALGNIRRRVESASG